MRWIFASCLALFLFAGPSTFVAAHDVLSPEVRQYLADNPDATPEEIKIFAKASGGAGTILSSTPAEVGFGRFMWAAVTLGIEHIFTGLDHVLFVVTLVLVAFSLREIFHLSITFTLAHSLTLILAGTTVLTLSARVVEPFIALSIVIMALLSLPRIRHWKISRFSQASLGLVFFFGLFHGLGFAGILNDISVSGDYFLATLLFFNLGIEIGQICIILVLFPIFSYLRRHTIIELVHYAVVSCIATIGTVWVISRSLGWS